ncbi:hypothetical protein [Geomonas propionica]|uniref:Uncharacterized protein n=1 Tax=Geomonas propionica TaxID=2798582 RepID=A0ABS0YPM7_9BACT|nr:hypothetical protein [Geomonas propionica]MBJ6799870.1 hypothetical protein [Geomonas propionica]
MTAILEMSKNKEAFGASTVTEYKFFIHGLPDFIQGRITEMPNAGNLPFLWEVSHFWAAKPEGHFYYPSSHEFGTFEEAYESMHAYLEGMTPHFKRNDNY